MQNWDQPRLKKTPLRKAAAFIAVAGFHLLVILVLTGWFSHKTAYQGPGLIRVNIVPDKKPVSPAP